MARYCFVTDLRVRAGIDEVFDLLVEPERWLSAWPDAVRVERSSPGDGDGRGRAFDAVVRAPLRYRLAARVTATELDRPHWVDMAITGDLEGLGRWRLSEARGTTDVQFGWDVVATPAWMRVLTPALRPLFERSHHLVVRHAAEAAAASLDAELLGARSRAVRHRVSS